MTTTTDYCSYYYDYYYHYYCCYYFYKYCDYDYYNESYCPTRLPAHPVRGQLDEGHRVEQLLRHDAHALHQPADVRVVGRQVLPDGRTSLDIGARKEAREQRRG